MDRQPTGRCRDEARRALGPARFSDGGTAVSSHTRTGRRSSPGVAATRSGILRRRRLPHSGPADRNPASGAEVVHLRPHDARPGSHVYATDGHHAFDFNGWTTEAALIAANVNACRSGDPNWDYDLVIVEGDLDQYWQTNNHRIAGQYPGDVVARAERYIDTLLATDADDPPEPQL